MKCSSGSILRYVLKEAQFGAPICRVILSIDVRREKFSRNPLGQGMRDLERYGTAIRTARDFAEVSVWHYTDKGNLVCGEGKNTEALPIVEFTIVIDYNLEFLNRMCPCESKGAAVHKFFAVGASIVGINPEEKFDRSDKPFYLIFGDLRD